MKQISVLFFLLSFHLYSQQHVPTNGIKESKSINYLLKDATILVSPNKTIQEGDILIKNNQIVEVSSSIALTENTLVIDCKGKTIVPSFIELYSSIGLPLPSVNSDEKNPQIETNKKGAYYWNEAIHPEVNAADQYVIDKKANTELMKMGFGLALTHVQDGIVRGTGALVALGLTNESKQIVSASPASFYSLRPGTSKQTYPSSEMGSIALLRQTFYDLQWYAHAASKADYNISLSALKNQVNQPMFFYSDDKLEGLRGIKIGNEFNFPFVIVGGGNEYAVVNQLKSFKNQYVLPINFPAPFDVRDPYIIKDIPLSELKKWELAPSNPAVLSQNGIVFSITSTGNQSAEDFWKNLHKAISRGLSPAEALNALTLTPAKLLNIDHDFGTIEKGKKANFMIYDGDPFREKSKLLEAWVLGERNELEQLALHDITGKYNLFLDGKKYPIEIKSSKEKLEANIKTIKNTIDSKTNLSKVDTLQPQVFIQLSENDLSLQFVLNDNNFKGNVSLHAKVNSKLGIFEGDGYLPNGKWIQWSAIRNEKETKLKEDFSVKLDTSFHPKIWFPNMAYGFDSIPKKQIVAFKNATVWTNEAEGILKNATVVVANGMIIYVGDSSHQIPLNAKVIDAKGKVLTSGIIDEHSHIAISKGVNESGQSNSAEVRVGDVINSEDISIYRQLAGGVTAAQLLHGSTNTIGGQSALIKLKWGHTPEEFLIPNAPKFIKCALGENVKQSNWGEGDKIRFPQTRMGVEQVFYDGFYRAKLYQNDWKHFKKNAEGQHLHHPHRDLELDVLSEILNGECFITCHSYVQSEINMLMKTADSLGFKINTFTHVLEGYKVADKLAKHGAAASTFSDWWGYKFEVKEAIPFNAKLMMDQGVLVGINSDDAEMGRRLNQEAAKSVKYGGMSEQDAWKMITLNPAKMLHLDHKIGSIKIGKDADLVLWSDNPLSILAKVEYTLVDGEILYDSQQNKLLEQKNDLEKSRIITKMLQSTEQGEIAVPFVKKKRKHFECDTVGQEGQEDHTSF